MARTRVETRARARALQALYAWDMRGNASGELERVATQVWDDLVITPDERRIAGPIVRLVAKRAGELDAELADVTTNWRLERIGAIERCVLRLAAAELTIGDTPPRVVIQEAVTLAERFGSAASAKFVNGVLDALARRMGRI
jgi:N utilization substance protein B